MSQAHLEPFDVSEVGKGANTAFLYDHRGFAIPKPLPQRYRYKPQARPIVTETTGTTVLLPEFIPQTHLVSAFPPLTPGTAATTATGPSATDRQHANASRPSQQQYQQQQQRAASWKAEVLHDHGLFNVNTGEWIYTKDEDPSQSPNLSPSTTPRGVYHWAAGRVVKYSPPSPTTPPVELAPPQRPQSQQMKVTLDSTADSETSSLPHSCKRHTTPRHPQVLSNRFRHSRLIHEKLCSSFLNDILGERPVSPSGAECDLQLVQQFLPNERKTNQSQTRHSPDPSRPIIPHSRFGLVTRNDLAKKPSELSESTKLLLNQRRGQPRDEECNVTYIAPDDTVEAAVRSPAVRSASVAFGHIPARPKLAQRLLQKLVKPSLTPTQPPLINETSDAERDQTEPIGEGDRPLTMPSHVRVDPGLRASLKVHGGFPQSDASSFRRMQLQPRPKPNKSKSVHHQSKEAAITSQHTTTGEVQQTGALVEDASGPPEPWESQHTQDIDGQNTVEHEGHEPEAQAEEREETAPSEDVQIAEESAYRVDEGVSSEFDTVSSSQTHEVAESHPDEPLKELEANSRRVEEPSGTQEEVEPSSADNNAPLQALEPQEAAEEKLESSLVYSTLQRLSTIETKDEAQSPHQPSVTMSTGTPEPPPRESHPGVSFNLPQDAATNLDEETQSEGSRRYFKRELLTKTLQRHNARFSIPVTIANVTTISPSLKDELLRNGQVLPESVEITKSLSYSRALQLGVPSKLKKASTEGVDPSIEVHLGPILERSDAQALLLSGSSDGRPATAASATTQRHLPYTSLKEWKRQRAIGRASTPSANHGSGSPRGTDCSGTNIPRPRTSHSMAGAQIVSGHGLALTQAPYPRIHSVMPPIPSKPVEAIVSSTSVAASSRPQSSQHASNPQIDNLVGSLAELTPEQLEMVVREAVLRREMRKVDSSAR